jgi:hypothetical protein
MAKSSKRRAPYAEEKFEVVSSLLHKGVGRSWIPGHGRILSPEFSGLVFISPKGCALLFPHVHPQDLVTPRGVGEEVLKKGTNPFCTPVAAFSSTWMGRIAWNRVTLAFVL